MLFKKRTAFSKRFEIVLLAWDEMCSTASAGFIAIEVTSVFVWTSYV